MSGLGARRALRGTRGQYRPVRETEMEDFNRQRPGTARFGRRPSVRSFTDEPRGLRQRTTRFRFDEDEFREGASRQTRPTAVRSGGDIEMADRPRVTRAPRMLSAREFADEPRYRPMRRVSFNPGEEEFEDVGLDDEAQESVVRQAAQKAAQTARTAAQNARTAAQQFVRQVATRLNAGYQRVPTSEIEAERDIEMGDIGTAEDTARSAQAAEASAEDAFQDIARGGVPDLVADSAAEEGGAFGYRSGTGYRWGRSSSGCTDTR